MRSITIQKNDAGQRLDKVLTKAVKGLPQSLMYKFIRTKKTNVRTPIVIAAVEERIERAEERYEEARK